MRLRINRIADMHPYRAVAVLAILILYLFNIRFPLSGILFALLLLFALSVSRLSSGLKSPHRSSDLAADNSADKSADKSDTGESRRDGEKSDWRDEEYQLAQKVVGSLVSREKCFSDEKLEVMVRLRYARTLGGDYYGIINACPREGYLTVFLGDVAGKGLSAALSTVSMMILLREASMHFLSPREVLTHVNRVMHDSLDPELFNTTVFFLLFDLDRDLFTCARGGHEHALFYHNGRCDELSPKGPLLGALQNPVYHDEEYEIRHGDRILLFTDGFVESRNGKSFTRDTLREIMCDHASSSAESLIDAVFSRYDKAVCGTPLEDDQALVVVTYKKDPAGGRP